MMKKDSYGYYSRIGGLVGMYVDIYTLLLIAATADFGKLLMIVR